MNHIYKIFFRVIYNPLSPLCFFSKYKLRNKLGKLRINNWHINSCYQCRAYKKESVDLCNRLEKDVIIDFGCGLGDIISKIGTDSIIRIGVDNNKEIIKAANYLNENKITFFYMDKIEELNDLLEINLNTVKEKRRLVFIAINIFHDFHISQIIKIVNILDQHFTNYIVLTDLTRGNDYKFCHTEKDWLDIGFFRTYFSSVSKSRDLISFRRESI